MVPNCLNWSDKSRAAQRLPCTHLTHVNQLVYRYLPSHISRMGHVLEHLLTELAQLPALLHPYVTTLRSIFSSAKIVPRAFLFERKSAGDKGVKIQRLSPGLFHLSRKALRTMVMLQILFYITSISRGIEIINLSHFHFIENLDHDEHGLAMTSCKIQ